MPDRRKSIERVSDGILRRDASTASNLAIKALLLVREGHIVHLWVHTGVYFADSFLTTDIEE